MTKLFPNEPAFPAYVPTVGNAVKAAAEQWGDKEFCITPEDRLTFADLDRRSRHLAARLVALGVGKGARVGTPVPEQHGVDRRVGRGGPHRRRRRAGQHVLQAVRARPVPAARRRVSTSSSSPPSSTTTTSSGLETVVPELVGRTDPAAAAAVAAPARGHPLLGRGAASVGPAASATTSTGNPRAALATVAAGDGGDVAPADPMLLMYTSGPRPTRRACSTATGRRRPPRRQLLDGQPGWSPDARLWTPMPFFWIGGFHTMMFRTLVAGQTLVVQDLSSPARPAAARAASASPT